MELFIEFFYQQIIWFLGLGLIMGMLVHSYITDRISGYKKVSSADSVRIINNGARIIDIRSIQEFERGHIKNATNILATDVLDTLNKQASNKEKSHLLVCNTGTKSGGVCGTLHKQGYTQVYMLEGGMSAWQDAKLPVFSKQSEKKIKQPKKTKKTSPKSKATTENKS